MIQSCEVLLKFAASGITVVACTLLRNSVHVHWKVAPPEPPPMACIRSPTFLLTYDKGIKRSVMMPLRTYSNEQRLKGMSLQLISHLFGGE